ncbi:MAG: diguanylate cyclase [Nitrospirota bacterium]
MNHRKSKLRLALIRNFTIIGIISAVISLATYTGITYHSIKEFAYENLAITRTQHEMYIKSWFHERVQDITQLTLSRAVREKDLVNIKRLLSAYMEKVNTDFDGLYYVDSRGILLFDGERILTRGINVKDRSYFQAALEKKQYVSEIIISRVTAKPTVIVSSPVINDQGAFAGVILGPLDLSKIQEITSSLQFGKTGETYLVDVNGRMLTESRSILKLNKHGEDADVSRPFLIQSEAVKRVLNGETGFGDYISYRGAPVLGAYQWISDRSWGLIVEIEKNEIIGSLLHKIGIFILIFLGMILLIIFPLARYTTQKIVEPIDVLTQEVSSFSEHYRELEPSMSHKESTYEEVDILDKSFHRMREKIGQLMKTLESQALLDSLTGLANRRCFQKRGQEIIELAQRTKQSCTIIFLDIDKFKEINDKYGHKIGDEVLVRLAKLLEENVRLNDVVCRYGGEEFIIISPSMDMDGAYQFAERLRELVTAMPLYHAPLLKMSISLGVSAFKGAKKGFKASDILNELIKQADQAMYVAKKKGRNRCEKYVSS